ncbi:tRNA lysidine(34) synthetase TilS [Sandarakinorhabdus sp.]|uniref:tRNA lysidine(34) synthetase TilS n=1 Tax=Sandarakinorhabdus sp. TaxID=1916663 RepID=UPI00286E0E3B|nr:tRNA lysidine(34) synthetase TilS [Sandarakinorhabdus sp.]
MRRDTPGFDLAALTAAAAGRPLTPACRIAIAVSGGPDSTALLALAAQAFAGQITALTVDHGLAEGSANVCASVARQCAARGIPHALLTWTGDKPTANIQALARAARYRLMGGWCAAHGHGLLLTAHHADDQAETLLMRMARGSGSGGLAGIRSRRTLADDVVLVRPLLALRRAELDRFASGWQVFADPANRSARFDRTAARQLLAATPWLSAPHIADAAAHLSQAAAALDWAEDRAWAGAARREREALLLDVAGLPAELVHRLLRRAITAMAPGSVARGSDIARLAARLGTGLSGTVAGVKAMPGPPWRFILAPARRNSARNAP